MSQSMGTSIGLAQHAAQQRAADTITGTGTTPSFVSAVTAPDQQVIILLFFK